MNPTRRRFVSYCAALAAAAGVAGCGEEAQKQEGTTTENPQDIQDALNRSSEGYESEKKKK
jgi:hypothetical protein